MASVTGVLTPDGTLTLDIDEGRIAAVEIRGVHPNLEANVRRHLAIEPGRVFLRSDVEAGMNRVREEIPFLHADHARRAEVEQLRYERGGTEVHRDPEPFARREREGRIVGENGGFPLRHVEGAVCLRAGVAGEAPSRGDLVGGEDALLLGGDGQSARQNPNLTPAAAPAPAAGKLDPVGEEYLLKRRAGRDFQDPAERLELDADPAHFSVKSSERFIFSYRRRRPALSPS
jgi:hypothetical protein